MKRKIVKEYGWDFSLYDLLDSQSFDEAMANLAKAKEDWYAKYPDAVSIKFEISGDDAGYCSMVIERWESDKEFEKRKRADEKAKLAKVEREQKAIEKAKKMLLESEAREKELLKQLQAKYGVVK